MLKSVMFKSTIFRSVFARQMVAALACLIVPYLPAQQTAKAAPPVKIAKDTLLQGALMQPLDPATARPGDDVPLRLTRPLTVGGIVVLPAGTVVHGKVTKVTPVGHGCTKGSVKWKLDQVALPDGSTLTTEVWNAYRPATRVPPDVNRPQDHTAGETVGYVIQDAVLLPLVVPGFVIYGAKQAVTAPFRHGSCSRWHDLPLPVNATVGLRVREDHEVRLP